MPSLRNSKLFLSYPIPHHVSIIMFALRRTVARAFASSPSTAFVAKPRSINTFAPAAFRTRQQNWAVPAFQKRFASDDAVNTEQKTDAEQAVAEASENFAQTAAEAPVEENLTPAQQASQAPPTDASATAGVDALEAAANSTKPRTQKDFKPNLANKVDAPKPNRTLYVGNLYYEVTPDQIQRVFSRFGTVDNIKIAFDNRGLSRGFAYVDMGSVEEARAAIENLDMQVFEGRNLVVQYHKPKQHTKTMNENGEFVNNPPSRTLFIGNMSYEMSDKDLNDLFRDVRNVLDVRVAIDRRTGQPRGFAHADFIDVASAVKAKEHLESKVIYGRQLRIDYSKNTTRRRDEGNAQANE